MQKLLLLAAVTLSLAACQDAPRADMAKANNQQQEIAGGGEIMPIDTASSVVTWIGTKPTGQHTGTFQLQNGQLQTDGQKITGGKFVIDINSLASTDMEGEYKAKLDDHLKSADFFDASRHPQAVFAITHIAAFDSSKNSSLLPGATHLVSGNLTLKDSTKNITFPAIIKWENNQVEALANFNIDRTFWGLNYHSDASLQDKFIRPEVNIQLMLKAQKM